MRKNAAREAPTGDGSAYTVRFDGLTGLPTDRDTATAALLHLLRLGYEFPRVALLRRDGPAAEWEVAEVESPPFSGRLAAANTRPYSSWRR